MLRLISMHHQIKGNIYAKRYPCDYEGGGKITN